MRHAKLVFLVIFHLSVLFSTPLTAEYRFDQWTTEDGLPQNSVNSIVQTKDGYIWFATFGGLVRFDGIKFKIFNTINAPVFKTNRIVYLTEGGDGTLWIGAQNGDLISYKEGVFTSVVQRPVSRRMSLQVFYGDRNGGIWLFGQGGLERYSPDAAGSFVAEHIEIPNEQAPNIGGVVEDSAGDVWVLTMLGLYRFHDGDVRAFLFENGLPIARDANGVIVQNRIQPIIDHKDRIWLASDDFLARFEDGRFMPVFKKKNALFQIKESTDDTFFLRAEGKIFRFAGDATNGLITVDPSVVGAIRSMISDREGNLWLGLNGQGLRRYKRQTARTFSAADGLTDGDVHFVFEDRDKVIWIGTDSGLFKYLGGTFRTVASPVKGAYDSAIQSSDGTIWFMTGAGLYTYRNDQFSEFVKQSGISGEAVFEDRNGTLYFVVADGLITIRDNLRQHFTVENGFVKSDVQSIVEDHDGGMWFAMTGGASRFKYGVFTNYTAENGLSNDNVRDIYEDRDGVIWFGTYGGGLDRLKDGKIFAVTTREGMNEDIVSRIIVDEQDNFWMLGNRGVSVISRTALNDLADGKIKTIACESYGVSDGMENSEGNGGHHPAGWLASDGRFWFPSIRGVIVIDPASSSVPPPPVYIEDVFLSGKQSESTGRIEIAPDIENIEIHYAGLNFSKPEQVKFRYKLEGFDDDWIEVGTRRVAYYTRLPAGNYHFLVTASTTSGVWNEQPAVRDVIVLSDPLWKKWWFILSVSVLAVLAIVMFYRLRLVRLERSRRQQQEFSRALIRSQEQERKRIAGELHDGLGQTLLIIKNRAFLGTKAGNMETVGEQFSEIAASSGEAINQAREIAYYLRPSQLERFGLTSAIEEMVRQAADSSNIEFESRLDSLDGMFSPENEINFYRVVQEGVNNILKHSQATKAKVLVARSGGKIELLIDDNGKGLAGETSDIQKRSGFGLFGLEERLRILGGKFSISSEAGNGTRIVITIDRGE